MRDGGPLRSECKHESKPSTKLNTMEHPQIRSLSRLGDNIISSFPLFLPLANTAFGDPEGYLTHAIIAFRAFEPWWTFRIFFFFFFCSGAGDKEEASEEVAGGVGFI